MAKPRGRARSKTKGRKGGAPAQRKRRPQLSAEEIDWKNYPSLRRFVSERGKIRSRRITGLSRRQQSELARAVKRARTMGLFPYPDQERNLREKSVGGGSPVTTTSTRAPSSDDNIIFADISVDLSVDDVKVDDIEGVEVVQED
jgi:small subunit ribosomal protein S18